MNILTAIMILLISVVPASARNPHHLLVAYDDQHHLIHQVRSVDIAVLDNDIGPGPESLRVVAVSGVRGGKAEIIDGRIVRVTVDWASYAVWSDAGGPMGQVAHGSYVISNGCARSQGTWTVWYLPDMKI